MEHSLFDYKETQFQPEITKLIINDNTSEVYNLLSLEELFDFDSEVFFKLIKTFSLCYDSYNFIKCQIILIKEIIPFFQSNRNIFEQYNLDISFFIKIFEANNFFNQFSHIIQESNELLLNPGMLLFSLLSSLHKSFCQCFAECQNLLSSLILHILEYEGDLFENSVILLNNTIRFYHEDIHIEFIMKFIEKIQISELNTKVALNILTNLIRTFNIPINEYSFFIYIINLGISQSLYLDSMNLIYYCYQNESNKNYLFSIFSINDIAENKIIDNLIQFKQLVSACFLNNDSIILFFRILIDFQSFVFENYDVDDQNRFKFFILENFQIETLKNALRINDPHILQYIFLFLSKSPHEIIAKFTHECFEDEKSCISFIINCIIDREFWLRKIAILFLPIFLKEMGPEIYMKELNEIKETNEKEENQETNENSETIKTYENAEKKEIQNRNNFFLNFLIDYKFLTTLVDFILSDESEMQKLALTFLNSMAHLNFFYQPYSKQLFEFFEENEFIQIIDELIISSEDSEISALAENVMNYFMYTMNDSNEDPL